MRAIPVDLPLPHPMEWATGCMASQAHVLVRIMTDEGVEGIAEAIPRENIYGVWYPLCNKSAHYPV